MSLDQVPPICDYAEVSIDEINKNNEHLAVQAKNILSGISLEDKNGKNKSQNTILVEIGRRTPMFYDEYGTYAQIYVNDHFELRDMASNIYREWLAGNYFQLTDKATYGSALKNAIETLKHFAKREGTKKQMSLRTALEDDAIYIDLTNDQFEQLKITEKGYEVIPGDYRFVRRGKPEPLPIPEEGEIDLLWEFLNVNDENDQKLIASYLIASLYPKGPYPILVLTGEQGSCKSTATKLIRSLLDPCFVSLSGIPKDKADLITEAHSNWVVALDNLSYLSAEISDALCRLSTGGGIKARKLYTDIEEMSVNIQRPVILNSINEIVLRGDLIERCIFIELPVVDEHKRKSEREFWTHFEQVRPKIFGVLVNALSVALKKLPTTTLARLPRMADFALLATSVELAFGWQEGDFMRAYRARHNNAAEAALENSIMGTMLVALMENRRAEAFQGTMSELLEAIECMAFVDDKKKPKGWPTSPRSMGNQLRDLAPHLRKKGIHVEWLPRTSHARQVFISFNDTDTSSLASSSSCDSEEKVLDSRLGDGHDDSDGQNVIFEKKAFR